MKVTLLGSSGTIGRAVALELARIGYAVSAPPRAALPALDLTGQDAVVSCIASRTGIPRDAWHVDHDLNLRALRAAERAGVRHFSLLSAICVQKPRLAFQFAKAEFEKKLAAAPITHTIIRPTAYFKSLSGQLERVRAGKPFLTFGNGALTSCKPISDSDLARFIVLSLSDPDMANKTLPIGGPGPAITPNDQADMLSEALGTPVRTRRVPPAMLLAAAKLLGFPGTLPMVFAPRLTEMAALARIGHYYATESMLVWDGSRYDADATPEFGADTLAEHYSALARGEVMDDRGAHAVF